MNLKNFDFRIWNKKWKCYEDAVSMIDIIEDKLYEEDVSDYKIEI